MPRCVSESLLQTIVDPLSILIGAAWTQPRFGTRRRGPAITGSQKDLLNQTAALLGTANPLNLSPGARGPGWGRRGETLVGEARSSDPWGLWPRKVSCIVYKCLFVSRNVSQCLSCAFNLPEPVRSGVWSIAVFDSQHSYYMCKRTESATNECFEIWYLLCSFIENQSISNKTVGFDKCNTHLSLGMFFLDSFSPRSKSPSLHHISAGKDPQPTGINRPFLAAPRLDRGCPHGNPCPFSSRAAGKAGRSASKVWRKVGELQLQFWLRYQYAIQYMI